MAFERCGISLRSQLLFDTASAALAAAEPVCACTDGRVCGVRAVRGAAGPARGRAGRAGAQPPQHRQPLHRGLHVFRGGDGAGKRHANRAATGQRHGA
eukprot:7065771-Prymnesium_polylepis.1